MKEIITGRQKYSSDDLSEELREDEYMRIGPARVISLFLAALLLLGSAAADPAGGLFAFDVLEDGSAVITGYRGPETDLVLPETIEGHTVSTLGRNFSTNTAAVKNLKSLTIPDTMTAVEPGALQFAGYLSEFRIAADHPMLSFENGVLYNKKEQSLVLYLQSNTAERFDIPNGICRIADRAFYRSRLVSINFPGSVEQIGKESFNQCIFLADCGLNEGLLTIGTEAFSNCDRLRSITIPASVTDIAESAFMDSHLKEFLVASGSTSFNVSDGALINVREGLLVAYPHSSEAESCTVPEGVKRIGTFAFYRSHNLKQVIFPDGLQEIGRGAFSSCNHLKALDLPDSVTKVENSAFTGNSDVERLRLPAGLTEITDNFNDMSISELEIPETVTTIKGSFCSLPNLTEVVIPDSVRTLSQGSFASCKRLAGITVPAGVTEFSCSFTGCSGVLVIRVEPGSTAEQYCKEHNLKYDCLLQ